MYKYLNIFLVVYLCMHKLVTCECAFLRPCASV